MEHSKNTIKDIADSLLCGMDCFYDQDTDSYVEYPKDAEDQLMFDEENPWQDIMEQIEVNEDDYILIDPIPSNQVYSI